MDIREDLFYTESHEWVKFEDDTTALVGLSDFAQSELGDLVFVNLPEEGDEVAIGDTIADVESVKAVSDVFAPVGGTVAAVNEELLDAPEKINEAPYEAWLCKIEGISDKTGLMNADEYEALIAK
ncbi:MAG: glycine cleavage system protein GcvH [Clostridiales bacterium]|nr:glycine cleavage system protein GcvH [Clostridiales bacterium]